MVGPSSSHSRPDDAQTILDAIPDAYIRLDADFCFTFVNLAAERHLGLPRDTLAGMTPWEVRPDPAHTDLETGLRHAKAAGVPHSFESYCTPRQRWFAITAIPCTDGLIVHFADVTERRTHDEQRDRSFDEAPTGIFRTNSEGSLLAANQALAKMLRYGSPGELVSLVSNVAEQIFARPEDYAQLREIGRAQGAVRGLECQFKCKDADRIWVSVTARKVTDSDGAGTHFEGFIEDISQRRERDEALRQAQELIRHRERQLSTIYESVIEALFLLSVEPGENYRFVTVNATLLRMTGLTADQVVGKPVTEVIPEPSLSLVLSKYRQAISGRSIVRWEETTSFPSGTKCGEVSVTPIFGENGICTHLVGTVHDTTESKRTAVEKEHLQEQLRQAQKLESVGRLAGGVAHDFNNILVVINGYAELLAAKLSEFDPRRQYALEIGKAGEHAASLTSQLLAFSRKQVVRARPLDLNVVVRDAERMLRRLIGEDIEFDIRPAAESAWVMADDAQIHQVIVNLAANARDAMPNGGTLSIATSNLEVGEEVAAASPGVAPGSFVVTTFSDTGVGMPEVVLQNIFEPFFTTKEQGKGTGLGLATVYGIVRQSRGWIEVKSQVGEGTSFRIYLPQIEALADSAGTDSRTPDQSARPATVLVVEDQDAVRELTKITLVSLGYQVLQAESGARAREISAAFSGEIDLLLTDVVMPGISGTELAGQILKDRPNLKVLLMSGYAEEEILARGFPDSKPAFLPKPFTPARLADKVQDVLGGGGR